MTKTDCDDNQGIQLTEHLVIREVETDQEVINQSSSSKNMDTGIWDD